MSKVKPTHPLPRPSPISASLRQRCPELLDDGEDPSPPWSAEVIPQDSEASTLHVPTPAEVNAEAIGTLLARVSRFERQDTLRLGTPDGEFTEGVIEKLEWLTRPYQEFTEHESALEPGVLIKAPGQWNCGTIRLVVRLTGRTGNVPIRWREQGAAREATVMDEKTADAGMR